MTLRFPYRLDPVAHPVLPLGGRRVRPRPVIAVTVIGPSDTRLRLGILDTAADDTVFPESLAAVIGIDLTVAPAGQAAGIHLAAVPLRYAQVSLRLTDGVKRREWQAWVGFTPARLYLPMLGFAGFLQFYSSYFHGDREEAELTVNRFYQGT